MRLIDIIESKTDATTYFANSKEKIHQAETALNVKFAGEYAEYIEKYGIAIFDGHELTGLCDGKRLDVVQITKEQRELNPFVPDDWYVVECLDIDGIIIWQNRKGEIYQTVPTNKARLISNSIAEYLA